MQDQNEIDFVVAVCRIADALERIGDVMETAAPKKRAPRKPKAEEAAGPDTEAEAPAEAEVKPKKKRAKRKAPKAQTEIETDGISLEELSTLAQDYSKERGKAGANRIRKFLSNLDMSKLAELDADQRETLAENLRK